MYDPWRSGQLRHYRHEKGRAGAAEPRPALERCGFAAIPFLLVLITSAKDSGESGYYYKLMPPGAGSIVNSGNMFKDPKLERFFNCRWPT